MKPLLILAALVAPMAAAATVAMEPAVAQASRQGGTQSTQHRLFEVRYVLLPNPAPLPHVVVERGPGLVPPAGPVDHQALLQGGGYRDPNAILCYGRGCEGDKHQ